MATENGVIPDDERGVIEKTHDDIVNGEKAIDIAVVEEVKSDNVVKSKKSNISSASKNGERSGKKVMNAKERVPLASNTKRGLSQCLSFPAKGVRPDTMKKSVDGIFMKNGPKPEGRGVNGPGSVSRSNTATRRASAAVNLKENGGGISYRRATIASVPSVQRSLSGKSGSRNESAKAASSDVLLPIDKQVNPTKAALSIKEDEDAHSTTSSNVSGQRRSESGFSFRLNERAEKRKEFFTKLEEKIQAKEAEKTNIQAKTMENQEEEIKQLRKSLTFKATPMPNFYKEPPAKIELKKIPTTRPKSPKLGRNKSFTTAKANVFEGGQSRLTPDLNQEEAKSPNAQASSLKVASSSKKPVKRSSSKSQSHKQAPVKAAGEKDVNTEKETKVEDTKSGAEKIEEIKENESKSVDSCEIKDEIKDECVAAQVEVEG